MKGKISTIMIVSLFAFSVLLGFFNLQTESSDTGNPTVKGRLAIEKNSNGITIDRPQDFENPEPLQSVGKIVFESERAGNNDIWVMNADGSNQVQLTTDGDYQGTPAWSPDGTKIAYRDGVAPQNIWIMDSDGSNKVQITTEEYPNGDNEFPTWSPDGKKIAFTGKRLVNPLLWIYNWDIWVMDADGSNQARLTTDPDFDWFQAWSPDGKKIAYTHGFVGNSDIWVMDADGSNKVQLTTHPSHDYCPDWSPDGKKIAFSSERAGNWDIWVMDTDGNNQVQLTTDPDSEWAPDWSPDGSKIAFTSNGAGNYDIWIMDADGSNWVQLTTHSSGDWDPDWSPQPPLPDYVPWNVSVPTKQKVSVGNSVEISTQVKNVGKINATVESTIAFDNQSPLPFETYTVPPLNASEVSKEYNATWVSPTTAGTYYVVIEVDCLNDIEELNEDNNTYVIEFNVTDKPITTIMVGTPQYLSADLYVTSSTQFTFTVEDYSGTGYNTYYYVDNPPWSLYTGPFTVPTEGKHTICYYSVDNLGGTEDTQCYIVRVDNTPPTTSISVGEPNYRGDENAYWNVTSSTAFTLSAVDGGLTPVGVQRTEYRVDESPIWITYAEQFNLSGLDDGIHTLYFRSVDNLVNIETEKSLIANVDNTPPLTTISPDTKKIEKGTLFTLTATDGVGSGVNYTQYSIDYGNWKNYTSPFSIDTYGHHNITYSSVDNLGNVEANKTLQVYIISKAPITTIHVGTPQYSAAANLYVTSSTQFTFTVVDNSGTGIRSTNYKIDTDGAWVNYTAIGLFTIPIEGEHTIYFNSMDNLGGEEDTKSFAVIVDNTPPTTAISPNNKDAALGTVFTINATDDNGSGVNYTQYSIDGSGWMNYLGPFTLNTYGHHNIIYRSVDNLGNVENDKNLSLIISPPEAIAEEEYNFKPLIALIFAIVLLVVGSVVAYKTPLKIVKGNRWSTWMIVVLPFIFAECLTGVISLLTGIFSVPPLLGGGMAVDLTILIMGLGVFIATYKKLGKK